MKAVLLLLLVGTLPVFAYPVISASEIDYPPFSFVDDSGDASGFSVELLTAALGAMGREAEYSTGPWATVMGWLIDGSVECLPLVGRTPEREPYFDFSFPYMSLHGAVVVRADRDSIYSIDDLSGLTVGVMSADNSEEYLLRGDFGVDIVSTPTFEDALLLLSQGTVDAVVIQRIVALRLIQMMGLPDLRVMDWPLEDFRQDFCFAVRKGNSELLALLNEGLAIVMADGTFARLHSKWFAHLELPSRRIVLGGDRNFPPYEYIDEEGNAAGLNVELVRAAAAEVGLDVEIRLGNWSSVLAGVKDGTLDGITGMFYSPARNLHFEFTQPHTAVHYVAVVREGRAPADTSELRGLSLVAQRGDLMHDFLAETGLDADLALVNNQEEALRGVLEGDYDCAVVARIPALYWMDRNGWDLVLGSKTLVTGEYCIAVGAGNRALAAEFSEGLRVLAETGAYRRIFEKWMGAYIEEPPLPFSEVLRRSLVILVPLLFLLLWIGLWLRLMRREVRLQTSKLRRNESLLTAVQEIARIGGWEFDAKRRTLFWTRETYRIHDMEEGSLSGEAHIEAILPCYVREDRERLKVAFERCLETGEPYDLECGFTSARGRSMWVRTGGRATVEKGAVTRVTGYIQDITEEKLARDNLRYKDSLLREMGRIALVGGWEFDPSTGKGTWTDEVARIHGMSPDEETSMKTGLRFYRGESRRRILRALNEAIEKGTPYDLELELVTGAGERKWVRTIGRPDVAEGRVVKVRGSFQDITSVKKSEARIEHLNLVLRAIRDINQLIVRETDPRTLIGKAATLLVEHRSYKSALLVLTDEKSLPLAWAGDGLAGNASELVEMLKRGEVPDCFGFAQEEGECVVLKRSLSCGSCPLGEAARSALALCVPLDHRGRRFGYLAIAFQEGTVLDEEEKSLLSEMAGDLAYALAGIGEREARLQAEDEREEMQRQLLQSQKMEAIGQLAGGVAHDFNNMLQVIMGHAQMLEGLCGGEAASSVSEILEGARRASSLTRQLLLFSRRQVMTLQPLDFNELVENMLRMIRRLIGEHIRLEWLPGAGLGSVLADPGMMEQVLMNLCVNARDAMPQGGTLTIETDEALIDSGYRVTHAWARPGRYLLLSVTDTGEGMSREILEHVFEPFYTTKDPGKGTGIGLATVYGIVKQHDGMVSAYSEEGKGSVFKVYLPFTDRESTTVVSRDDEAVRGGGETILLAEDDDLVRELARTLLERAGYRVLTAVDGEDAVEVFRKEPSIDLLLLDVIMPRLGGHEALDRIRGIRPGVPVVFSSGYSENAIHTNFVLHQGLMLVKKPYTTSELLRAVRKALETGKR